MTNVLDNFHCPNKEINDHFNMGHSKFMDLVQHLKEIFSSLGNFALHLCREVCATEKENMHRSLKSHMYERHCYRN